MIKNILDLLQIGSEGLTRAVDKLDWELLKDENTKEIEEILENSKDQLKSKKFLLFFACKYGKNDLVKFILLKGASIDKGVIKKNCSI